MYDMLDSALLPLGYRCCYLGYIFTIAGVSSDTRKSMLYFQRWVSILSILTCIFWFRWSAIPLSIFYIIRSTLCMKHRLPVVVSVLFILIDGIFHVLSHEENPYAYFISIILAMFCTGFTCFSRNVKQMRIGAIIDTSAEIFLNIFTGFYFMAFIDSINTVILARKLYVNRAVKYGDELVGNIEV